MFSSPWLSIGDFKSRMTAIAPNTATIIGNAMMLTKQNLKLLEIYNESFGKIDAVAEFDLD